MKNPILRIWILLILALSGTATAWTQDRTGKKEEQGDPAKKQAPSTPPAMVPSHAVGGYFAVGAVASHLSGSPLGYAEYTSVRQGVRPTVQLGTWGDTQGFAYNLYGNRGVDPNDQRYGVEFDLKRIWKMDFSFSRLPHRIENDPLSNLDVAKGSVVVRHDSLDADIQYCPYYQNMEINNRITIPSAPMVSFHVSFREQSRRGSVQERAVSKCSNCHISSFARNMDQQTREVRAGMEVRGKRAGLQYEYSRREIKENAATLLWTYDRAIHPTSQADIFINRVQYDQLNGPLPIGVVPRFQKEQHQIRANLDLARAGELRGTFVTARSSNEDLNFGTDTRVASGAYYVKLGNRFSLTLQARNVDIDADPYYVQVSEPVATTGPQAGKTFTQAYPSFGPASYTAESSLARTVFTGSMTGRLRLPHRTSVRFAYQYESTSRPNFDVGDTDTQKLKFSVTSDIAKTFKTRASYSYTHVNDAFANIKAAFSPQLQPFPAPGTPPSPLLGTQYYVVYGARQANLSNFPTSIHESYASATWAPAERMALNLHLRASKQRNSELNFAPWTDSEISPSGELWVAASNRIDLSLNYSMHRRHTESLFAVNVYDG